MTQLAPLTNLPADRVLDVLRTRILVDGFHIVLDPQASHGSFMHDALTGHDFLDFYSFFASMPLGFGHPRMREPEFQGRLLAVAGLKVANPDVYTRFYAEFVQTLSDVAGLAGLHKYFFIDGGALAVENALKTAFDWKVRKNLAAGRGEIGSQVIHFRHAFHGRTGYTMSLTNTDPTKTQYFPRFPWPRIESPAIDFSLPDAERDAEVALREQAALAQIESVCDQRGHDVAALILEPIQCEGGDRHFRGEFLRALRDVCDRREMLLIFDEVQTGVGITGRMWCCEHFDVQPDILCFGKKMQTCGIMVGDRIDDVPNVFKVPSRINSTWGGNLTDMVRATQILGIIRDERLVDHAAAAGARLQDRLIEMQSRRAMMSAARGRGLMCAFDLPSSALRDKFHAACIERKLMILKCGERSARLRPVLDIEPGDVDRGVELLDEALGSLE